MSSCRDYYDVHASFVEFQRSVAVVGRSAFGQTDWSQPYVIFKSQPEVEERVAEPEAVCTWA